MKSKGSQPMSGLCFPPKFVSNLYPPPGPNRPASSREGPSSSQCCPESVCPLLWLWQCCYGQKQPGAEVTRTSCTPGCGLGELFPTNSSPSGLLTAAALPRLGSQPSPALLLSPARAPRFLLAESTDQILDFSRGKREGLSISPCCSSTSCTRHGPATSILFLPCSRQLRATAPAEFHHFLQHQVPFSSVSANGSTTKPSPDGER